MCAVTPDRHEGGRKSECTRIIFLRYSTGKAVWHPYPTTRNEAVRMDGKGNLANSLYLVPASDEERKEHLHYSLCVVHTRCGYRHYDIQFDKL